MNTRPVLLVDPQLTASVETGLLPGTDIAPQVFWSMLGEVFTDLFATDRALLEDRAILRISSRHTANWQHHDFCSEARTRKTMIRMATVANDQNQADDAYMPMPLDLRRNVASQAALDMVFQGRSQARGHTEAILTRRRRECKAERGSQRQSTPATS